MVYWLILLLVVVCAIGFNIYKKYSSFNNKLAELKAGWGKPLDKGFNEKMVAAYLNLEDERNISPGTADDIDLESIFAYIDRTSSKPGEQYLYKKLHCLQTEECCFAELEKRIDKLTTDENIRANIQLQLSKLDSNDAYYLPDLFAKPHESLFEPFIEFYIRASALLTISLIVALVALHSNVCLVLLMGVLLTNMVVHLQSKNKILRYTRSLPQLLILYDVANWLFKNHYPEKEEIEQSLTHLAKLKRSLRYVNLQGLTARDPTDLVYLVTEWLNMLLLIEPLNFILSIRKVNAYLNDVKALYEFVAEADMAISIRSVRDGLPYYCKPDFTGTGINIVDVFHPAIEDCVANSISNDNGQGVLVTGSNMSGKTTFIRAVTINTLLAQTIYTCCARAYTAPPLKIFTSIRISDDIDEHKSYFQAEALSILNIIENCPASDPVKSLIVIDEIFRGTNTIERVAAAKAVLSYLIANKNFVFVSTHDLELAQLLGDEYAVYSFEELMGDDRLVFDYKIKKGLLKNKNGIAVLQGMGYPQAIIDDAYQVSKQLKAKYDL